MSRRSKRNPVVGFVKQVAAHKKNKVVSTLLTYVAPAIGAYAATHVVGRVAQAVAAKRWPAQARFVGFGAKLATAGLVYYASDKISFMKQHREAILAGVGVALFESLVRLMLPGMAFAIDGPAVGQLGAYQDAADEGANDADPDPTDADDLDDLGGGIFDDAVLD